MPVEPISRHRTAIHRAELSRPIRLALSDNILNGGTRLLDYGCGHGDDVDRLSALGISCIGWDPVHRPEAARTSAEVVNLGYVVNVIEKPEERMQALRDSWALTGKVLTVSARLQHELPNEVLIPTETGGSARPELFKNTTTSAS